MHRLPVFLLALLTCGCSSTPSSSSSSGSDVLDLASYDQSCQSASDCAVVSDPHVCVCSCAMVAVNVKDADRYRADYKARQDAECAGVAAGCGACPSTPVAVCTASRCATK